MRKELVVCVDANRALVVLSLCLINLGAVGRAPQGSDQALVSEASDHQDDGKAVLQQSKPLVSRTGAWQSYGDSLHLKSGLVKTAQFKLTNGADGRPPLTDMRVDLARKPFITLKDFNGAATYTCNLDGKVTPGNTHLNVHVFGPSGARMVWQLLVDKPIISGVNPNSFGLNDEVTVQGKNFSSHAHDLHVSIGGTPVKVASSSATELKLKLPAHLPGGKQELIVAVESVKSSPFEVMVKSNPHLTSVDHLSTAPGHPVVIIGTGFSTTPSENVVEFGQHKAEVTAATDTRITCIVPQMEFPRWHVPITVTTNGMKSKGRLEINIDIRVIENEGVPIP